MRYDSPGQAVKFTTLVWRRERAFFSPAENSRDRERGQRKEEQGEGEKTEG